MRVIAGLQKIPISIKLDGADKHKAPTSAPYRPLSLRYGGRANMLSEKFRNSSPCVLGCCCVVATAFVVEERVLGSGINLDVMRDIVAI